MSRELPDEEIIKCVAELRQRLKEEMSPEMYADTSVFLRFLKARNFNINAADKMLRNHINWRKVNKVDSIALWYSPPEVLKKYLPISHLGFDKEGSPITYVDYGNFDFRGCLKAGTMVDVLNFVTQHFEADTKYAEKLGEQTRKEKQMWTYIWNFENFSLANATNKETISTIINFAKVYEANYPERLKWVAVINASKYFQMAFAIVKPFLQAETVKKVNIFRKEGWQEKLLAMIDADVLPAFLGGNRTDPDGDPMCKTFVTHGGLVPKKYFEIENNEKCLAKSGVNKLVINHSSKERVELLMSQPDSYIEWEFEIKGGDINFKLLYEESNLVMEDIFCMEKVETSAIPEEGVFKCSKPGKYYLEFDNSYNDAEAKEVFYIAKVINPDDNDSSSSTDLLETKLENLSFQK